MGYWVNTTYINHGDVRSLATTLEKLFALEGMERIQAPPRRERLLVEPMQYEGALQNDLWGIAIVPGAPSWSAIQTAPLELLAERAPGSEKMRLAKLCVELSARAFQLNVYDSTGTILVEVSNDGKTIISGLNTKSDAVDPFTWHEERLDENFFEASFRLHPFQNLIAGAPLGEVCAEILAQRFGGANSTYCDNSVSVDTLISHKQLTASGGLALYFKWPNQSRQRYAPCASWDDYRAAVQRKVHTLPRPKPGSIKSSMIRVGQRVRHPQFGIGVVLSLAGQGNHASVHVDFEGERKRWLMLALSNLELL